VPVPLLERDELGATNASNGLGAAAAAFGKQFPVAVSTVGLLVLGCELLTCQQFIAVGTGEAFTVPRCVLVADSTFVDHITTLGAALGILALVAGHTYDSLVPGDEALVADGLVAFRADEALVMPLFALVLELLHPASERLTTSVTPGREIVVMAVGAVDLVVLGGERLVYQRLLAAHTLEAELVPVPILVGQILVIWADGLAAVVTVVGKQLLVARDAIGVFLLDDVPAGDQLLVAVVAGQVLLVVVLLHGFRVLGGEDQLQQQQHNYHHRCGVLQLPKARLELKQ
jgi:hypothetical protein